MKIRTIYLIPIVGVLALLTLYSIYWFYAKSVIQREVAAWISEHETAGYAIQYEDLRVTGFPYRFQIEVTQPDIESPAGDGGWHARFPALRANALPYDFSHWIVAFTGPALIDTDSQDSAVVQLDIEDARLSLVSNRAGETVRIGAEFDALVITPVSGDAPDVRAIDSLRLSGQVEESDSLRVRVELAGIQVTETAFEPDIIRAFGDKAELVRLDLAVTQWSALARDGDAAAWSRMNGQMQIVNSQLSWGPARVTGDGDFTLDSLARPDGRLSLHITDPDTLADALVLGGLVPEENEQALRLAAMLAPRGPDGVSLPFRIRDGGVYLGPVRLGGIDE